MRGTQSVILRQWLLLLVLLAGCVVAAVQSDLLWRTDHSLYDAALPQPAAPDDVVIIAIDDASIERVGRWPWRRALHVALLDRLAAAGVRAVALDIVFTEADTAEPRDDEFLAAAMRRGPPTVLPLIVQWPRAGTALREMLPLAPLATAAARVGHAHLEIDRDGIARSVFLREGQGTPGRPHLAVALLEAAGDAAAGNLPGTRAPAPRDPATDTWRRDYQVHVPFAGPPGTIHHVSYVDVLEGRVAVADLRGRYVLVGVTAQGLGDAYATPRSGQGIAMPGVEISANVLGALRQGTTIRFAGRAVTTTVALLALCAAFLGFLRLSPRAALLCTSGLVVTLVAASLLSLRLGGYWLPPSVAVAALVLAYPLWSWRRLEATQQYLDREFAAFDDEDRTPLPVTRGRRLRLAVGDVLQARIDRAQAATSRLRHLRRILDDTIAAVPDAILLVDPGGRIVLGNPIAATLFRVDAPAALVGLPVDPLLATLGTTPLPPWRDLAARAPLSLELATAGRQDLMLRIASFSDGSGMRSGSVVDIADVTALKRVQRERDDTIHFLSHDLRSPSSSLLGLASMLRDPRRAAPLPLPEVARQIETLAGRTLSLADGFIALARAQTIEDDRFAPLDLKDALQDAIDDVWAAAQARDIRVLDLTAGSAEGAPVRGDRQMLGRCLANLLGNAVKFSPEGSTVDVWIERRGECWTVTVQDVGPGIAPERQRALFQRFSRGLHAADSDPGGVGLGLAFVQVVAQKHAGSVSVESAAGSGASFTLSLPADASPGEIPQWPNDMS